MANIFLLGIDSYSSWPIIKLVPILTADVLITLVRYMFSEYGEPHVIVTDNGRQFVSTQFEKFLRRNGVLHLNTPPWHPTSNGVIERMVHTFKRFLSKLQIGDIHARLERVLYAMGTSPSSKHGLTPSEVLVRPFRTHLTQLHPNKDQLKGPCQHDVVLHPGECVWVLKHSVNLTWRPGCPESLLKAQVQGRMTFSLLMET